MNREKIILEEAFAKFQNEELEDAELLFNKVLIINPKSIDAKEGLSIIYILTGRLDESLDTLDSLLHLKPNDEKYLFLKATSLSDLGQDDEAETIFDQLISLDPNNNDVYKARGILYQKQGSIKKALIDYSKVIEEEKTDETIYCNRAVLFMELQQYEKAEKDLKAALKINPQFEEALWNFSLIQRGLGNSKIALKSLNKVRYIAEGNASRLLEAGIIYKQNKEYAKALELYNQALQIESNNFRIYYSRAALLLKHNELQDAKKDLDLACNLCNGELEEYILNGYSELYKKQKDFDKAIEYANKALKINSLFYWAHATLAEIYWELNNEDKSLYQLGLALKGGFKIVDMDESISKKYKNNKKFKALLKEFRS